MMWQNFSRVNIVLELIEPKDQCSASMKMAPLLIHIAFGSLSKFHTCILYITVSPSFFHVSYAIYQQYQSHLSSDLLLDPLAPIEMHSSLSAFILIIKYIEG